MVRAVLAELVGKYNELCERALADGYMVGPRKAAVREAGSYISSRRAFPPGGPPGAVIEMSHATPTRKRIFGAVRAAAAGRDRSDPIRRNRPG